MSIHDRERFTQWFCRTTAHPNTGKIEQVQGWKDPIVGDKILMEHTRRCMDCTEQGVREALIKLGWTPPEGL